MGTRRSRPNLPKGLRSPLPGCETRAIDAMGAMSTALAPHYRLSRPSSRCAGHDKRDHSFRWRLWANARGLERKSIARDPGFSMSEMSRTADVCVPHDKRQLSFVNIVKPRCGIRQRLPQPAKPRDQNLRIAPAIAAQDATIEPPEPRSEYVRPRSPKCHHVRPCMWVQMWASQRDWRTFKDVASTQMKSMTRLRTTFRSSEKTRACGLSRSWRTRPRRLRPESRPRGYADRWTLFLDMSSRRPAHPVCLRWVSLTLRLFDVRPQSVPPACRTRAPSC